MPPTSHRVEQTDTPKFLETEETTRSLGLVQLEIICTYSVSIFKTLRGEFTAFVSTKPVQICGVCSKFIYLRLSAVEHAYC